MKSLLVFNALLFAGILSGLADDKTPPTGYAAANIVLYQPNDVLEQRMPDAAVLAEYVKKLEVVLGQNFGKTTTPETLDTVVAVRPGGRVAVWFVSSTRPGGSHQLDALGAKLEAIKPIEVRQGPVVFAIVGKLAGGDATKTEAGPGYMPPMPQEWKDANKDRKDTASFDDFLSAAWP